MTGMACRHTLQLLVALALLMTCAGLACYGALVGRPALKATPDSNVALIDSTPTAEPTTTLSPTAEPTAIQTPTAPPASASSTPTPAATEQPDPDPIKQETRAIWSWAGRKTVPGRDEITRHDVDELVAKVDAAHLNVILLHVYHEGTAFFEPSRTRFPDSSERLINGSAFVDTEYRDALSYLLSIRDQRRADDNPLNDFEVHTWISVMKGGDIGDGYPPTNKTESYMLNGVFPEFKLKYNLYYSRKDERFIRHDVSVIHQPRYRAYMADLIAGLVEDYDIDGVHLDYIRAGYICFNDEALDYPGTAYDYPGCQQGYRDWTRENYDREYTLWEDAGGIRVIQDGDSGRIAAWQASAVSTLVKEIHSEVKSVRPEVILSVASVDNPTTPEARKASIQGQFAWEWLDEGWIDAIFVTSYSSDTQWVIDKTQAVRKMVQDENRHTKVFPGLATHETGDPELESRSHLLVEQVNAVMHAQWTGQPLEPPVRGMALFRAGRLSEEAIQTLVEGPFKEPARPFWGQVYRVEPPSVPGLSRG